MGARTKYIHTVNMEGAGGGGWAHQSRAQGLSLEALAMSPLGEMAVGAAAAAVAAIVYPLP